MTLRTNKYLKSKNVKEKKVYIHISQGYRLKKNWKSKPTKFWLEKGLFFGSP